MSRASWNRYLEGYHGQNAGITELAFEHAVDSAVGSPYDWLLSAVPGPPGDVLDLACGSAPLYPLLDGASSYLGVDLSHAELAAARARGRGPVVVADARCLPVADRSVDTVVSSMGLMLVRPLTAALDEIARVLRPGGHAAFLLPAAGPVRAADLRPLLALARHLHGPGSMPQRVGRRRLSQGLGHVGLTVVATSRHRFPFPLRTADDARLALRALYTPGRSAAQLAAAERALDRLARPGRELPLPLLRVVARRSG